MKEQILVIFDFDDTLVFSGAVVYVTHGDGTKESLESHEFATYVNKPGDQFDFSEFDVYPPDGRVIDKTFDALLSAVRSYGQDNVAVLSARGEEAPMRKFLKDSGLSANIDITGVASSDPAEKALYVDTRLQHGTYTQVIVYEDSMTNIKAIGNMISEKYPGVDYVSNHVQAESLLRKTVYNLLKEFLSCK
jgi:hypothetical protein